MSRIPSFAARAFEADRPNTDEVQQADRFRRSACFWFRPSSTNIYALKMVCVLEFRPHSDVKPHTLFLNAD
jgi:hypothetical protein